MKHLDLFSGIGGFALAVDRVWPGSEHIFCDNDIFCQKILNKHWPKSKIYGDIRTLTNTKQSIGRSFEKPEQSQRETSRKPIEDDNREPIDILTGGFPCQPFSQAGKRGGSGDDRFLWPEMLRVIKEFKPTWIIGENVAGILNMAEQQGDTDMESEDFNAESEDGELGANGIIWGILNDIEQAGYSVQTFIIPAVAVNAPHRRDRVWIIAHSNSNEYRGRGGSIREKESVQGKHRQEVRGRRISGTDKKFTPSDTQGVGNRGVTSKECGAKERKVEQEKQGGSEVRSQSEGRIGHVTNSDSGRIRRHERESLKKGSAPRSSFSWEQNWLEVATELCGVANGLPARVDGLELSAAGHRVQRLKALGNAIVPQVAEQIMRAIKHSEENYVRDRTN